VNELRLTLRWIAQAAHGRLRAGDPDGGIGAADTDCRALAGGDLFGALRGPRFAGHTFAAAARERGAGGVVAAGPSVGAALRQPEAGPAQEPAPTAVGVIEVDNTLQALQDVAQAVRATAGTRVIGITGSAGKTTT
jgi:UDP-N-acetylmuramoyl-tripeptide--D-alanyl-D-alanine ligase